jgi:serine/threonine protein kinase
MTELVRCDDCDTAIEIGSLGFCPVCVIGEALDAAESGESGEERDPFLGSRFGPYEILEPLGAGGMGRVYKAKHERLGRAVAVKVLPPDSLTDARLRHRFLREARSASALNHPNIVTVHDLVSEGDRDCLVMEYVEGQTLAELVRTGPLPLPTLSSVAKQLANALAAAHQAGIVHRDVKPSNVIVGPDGVAKLLDFGLAKLQEGAAGSADPTLELTRVGAVVGTVPYMSPEQIEGKAVDFHTDIFSLGVVLHEAATGSTPFGGDSAAAVSAAILRETPPAPRQLRPELPEGLAVLIGKCLVKSPAERNITAAEVLAALEEIGSEPATRVHRMRVPRVAWAALATALLLATGWWVVSNRTSTGADVGPPSSTSLEQVDSASPSMEDLSTRNRDAYFEYLRGVREMQSIDGSDRMRRAAERMERAVEIDPEFAEAWGRLAIYQSMAFFNGRYAGEPRAEIVEAVERAVARAGELAPDGITTRLARGYYHRYVTLDQERAYHELRAVVEVAPDHLEALKAMGAVQRRRGEFGDSLRYFRRGLEIVPTDMELVTALAQTCGAVRDHECAAIYWDKAIAAEPEASWAFIERSWTEVQGYGSLETARTFLEQSAGGDTALPELSRYERDFETYSIAVAAGEPQGGGGRLARWHVLMGFAERLRGEEASAVRHFEAALTATEEMFLTSSSDSNRVPIVRGLALAYLGRSEEAIRLSRSLPDVIARGDDRFVGPQVGETKAWILAAAGAAGEAIGQLERMLATDYARALTVWDLRLDPIWDPLRGDPRFESLIADADAE